MKKFSLILCGILSINITYGSNIVCKNNLTTSTQINNTIKWYRHSAEKIALYQQTFNNGLSYIKTHKSKKPWGIVLDIDETTLDNSWYYEKCGLIESEDEFSQYVVLPEASQALPGAKNLTCSIQKMGGYVTLVSNRDGSYILDNKNVLTATINNLKSQGICFDQVLLANKKTSPKPSDKNPRFNATINGTCDTKQMICSNLLPPHKVIAYFGDNIQDFPNMFQADLINTSPKDSRYNKFSDGYFILPNPLYGSWMRYN